MLTGAQQRTVALVGRPNVGKSRLFNRLTRRRIAIVHDQPGVTRDVNAAVVDDSFTLLDTGGIGLEAEMSQKEMVAAAEEQVFVAMEAASVICFVVDGREGCTALDETLAERLRAYGKPVYLVVNKVDDPSQEARADDFAHLGFSDFYSVSAEHGYHVEDLLDALHERLGPLPEVEDVPHEEKRIRICFAGRPNVGKSSLCNRLLKADRLVVSEVPGTTRDSVELDLDYSPSEGARPWPFRLVDTAGVRRNKRLDSPVEYFSTVRSRRAIEESDVVFLVIDAMEGVTRQDKALMGEIIEAGKCCAVLVNKWDYAMEQFEREPLSGYKDEADFRRKFQQATEQELFFLPSSPVLFVSALTGFSVERILKLARVLDKRADSQLPTPKINKLIESLTKHRSPRILKGKRFKIYYAVQTGNRPFYIKLFCNRAGKLDDSYRRYLQNGFIEEFGLQGCPLRFGMVGKERRYSEGSR